MLGPAPHVADEFEPTRPEPIHRADRQAGRPQRRREVGFEIVTEPMLSLFSFRCPGDDADQQRLVDAINDDGRIYLTQGAFEGRKIIRVQVGQFDTTREDVMMVKSVVEEVWQSLN